MREIKFRMWNQFSELEGKYLYSTGEVMECLKQQIRFSKGEAIGYDHCENGSVFEQYTGLKDKNWKEIYEGDIYKTLVFEYTDDFGDDFFKEKKYVVEYSEGVCSIGFQLLSHHSNCEVIGNIHENKDLL